MIDLTDKNLLKTLNFIDGEWRAAEEGRTLTVHDKANGQALAEVPLSGAAEAQQAVEAAQKAFGPWRARSAAERGKILLRWFELMHQHVEDLAKIMTAEQGKPLAEARGEIFYAASYLEWFAEEGKRAYGQLIPSPFPDRELAVIRQPVGVCAAITPWNFPAAMITRKAAAALAAGCTLVLKPSELTPLSAFALAELSARAGLPAGVFNVLTGEARDIGAVWTSSAVVRKLSFTGSTPVGQLLAAQCAGTVKKLSLELGGNAPFIVFDDADLDAAVAGALASKFRNAGQTCVCSNRFLVQDGVYDAFAEKFSQAITALKLGAGRDEGVTQGPLIDGRAVDKVERLLGDAIEKGAKILAGGARHALGGNFFAPTLLGDVTRDMAIGREEIFGPVAPLFRFKTEEEAVALANDTEFGLAAYFYSRDHARVWRVGKALDFGMVGVNTGLISTEIAPFGGVKFSGQGREGSSFGLDDYLDVKYLALGGLG